MKNLNKKVVLVFSLIIAMFTQRALAKCNNPADLDPTFGPQNSGIVTINFGGFDVGRGGLVIDDQGRIVVSGDTSAGANPRNFAVARLLSNGLLDTSFAGDGTAIIDINSTDDEGAGGVVRDTQGRLLVAGSARDSENSYAVVRLLPNGLLDTSFGPSGDGKVVGPPFASNFSRITGIKLNKEGKIVLFGFDSTFTGGNGLQIIQLNSDGSPDSNFGNNGQVSGFGVESASDFIIDTQGRIIVVGQPKFGGPLLVARLTSNGSFDSNFGTDGKITISNFGDSHATGGITLTRAGKIVILATQGGQQVGNILVFQLNNDGSFDITFGTNGSTIIDLGGVEEGRGGITIDSWGNIYAFGTINKDPGQLLVARLKKDGSLDTAFGNNGLTQIIVGTGGSTNPPLGGGIVIDAQGRVVLLGTDTDDDADFAVVRLCGDQLPVFVTALREKYRANCSVLP